MISTTQEKQTENFSKRMEIAAKQVRDIKNGKIPRANLQEQLDKIDNQIENEDSDQ
ncbi:hypothetical protein [Lentibacillus salinarum]|uniref:Uncharacterized protein n=1 Tax=Lentibacillus salinarum TaxID=446820 RepID=A0ABW3ZUI2_9BACI